MIIKCPKCNKEILNDLVNLKIGIAQCEICNISFSISTDSKFSDIRNINKKDHDIKINDLISIFNIELLRRKDSRL